jgi:integrase
MAWSEQLIADNPALRLWPLRRPDRAAPANQKRPFTAAEIGLLLKLADDEWRGMILAGYHTAGQRLGDIATLTPSAIDLGAKLVKFESGKTGRLVALPIAAEWARDLEKRMKGKGAFDPLFPRAAGKVKGEGGKVGHLSNSFRSLLSRAKLASPPGTAAGKVKGRREQQPLSFHSFRHTATSLLKNAGVSDSVTRDIVGHDSAAVSLEYTHIDAETKRAAMSKLPDIAG